MRVAFVLVVVCALGASVVARASAAPKPCWQLLVADWYGDGRIDGTYPPPCYRAALERLPADGDGDWPEFEQGALGEAPSSDPRRDARGLAISPVIGAEQSWLRPSTVVAAVLLPILAATAMSAARRARRR